MDVLPLSLSSPAAHFDEWHRLDRLVFDHELRGIEPPTHGESLMELDGDAAEDRWGLLAVDGDRALGAYVAEETLLEDLDVGRAWLVVDPVHRGRGVAARLLAAARERHADNGRKRIASTVLVGSAGSAFTTRIGARAVQVELCNLLDVADAAPDLADLAGTAPPGYTVRTWQDRCPDELLVGYAAAHEAMNDVPTGDAAHDDWSWTPERVRLAEARQRRAGIHCLTTAVVQTASGEVAGYTNVQVPGRPTTVVQEDTGVVRRHRGHGLGLVVKATNLLRVRDAFPSTKTVMTWNAEDNKHMLAVNHRMGFRLHSRWEQVMLDL